MQSDWYGTQHTVTHGVHLGSAGLKLGASVVAQTVKRLPVMRETWVQPLGQEDHLGKEMATHSSTLARKIP